MKDWKKIGLMSHQIKKEKEGTLTLTEKELDALKWLLVEEGQRMDDDGREGSFDRSPLKAIYLKTLIELGNINRTF